MNALITIAIVVVGGFAAIGYGWMVADMIPRPPKIGEPERRPKLVRGTEP